MTTRINLATFRAFLLSTIACAHCAEALPADLNAQTIGPDYLVSITASDHETEPAIATLGSKMVVVWSRQYPSSVSSAHSLDGGVTWTTGLPLPRENTTFDRIGTKPSVWIGPDESVFVAAPYTISRESIDIWRGSFSDGMIAWSPHLEVLPPVPPGENKWDCPAISGNLNTGHLYLAATQIIRSSTYQWDFTVFSARSTDGGTTWSVAQPLSSTSSTGPNIIVSPTNEVFVIWMDFASGQIKGKKSTNSARTFGAEFPIAPMNNNVTSGPPNYISHLERRAPLPGGCTLSPSSDFPSAAVDTSSGPYRGSIYVVWAEYGAGSLSPQVRSVFDQEPNNFFDSAQEVKIGDDIYGDLVSGDFLPGGLSDRDTYYFDGTAGTTVSISAAMQSTIPPGTGNSVRCGTLDLLDGQDTMHVERLARLSIEETSTGLVSRPLIFTLPHTGRFYLTNTTIAYNQNYQFRVRELAVSPTEVARDHRDVVMVYSRDGGLTWTPKQQVNDDPPMFDNAIPQVSVDPEGKVHVAWYDRRNYATEPEYADTYWTMSLDGGTTFLPSRRVNSQLSSWDYSPVGPDGSNIGDNIAIAHQPGRTIVFWTQQGHPDVDIYAADITMEPVAARVFDLGVSARGTGAVLRWKDDPDLGVTQFRVHKKEARNEVILPGQPQLHDGFYELTDASVEPGHDYQFRIEAILREGGSAWSEVVPWSAPVAPLSQLRASPNPFARFTNISADSDRGDRVDIFDIKGRLLRTLPGVDSPDQSITWDGRDSKDVEVPSGTYLIRISGKKEVVKVTKLAVGQ